MEGIAITSPLDSETPREEPWPRTVDAKGPFAIFALLGFVLLHAILLIYSFAFSGSYVTTIQLAQLGMVSFWLSLGVSPLAIRLFVTAALLIWLANSNSLVGLGRDVWLTVLVMTACISAGVGRIAALVMRSGEGWQFRIRDLLVTISLCAVALAIMQQLAQQGGRITGLMDHHWHLIQIQIIFHSVLIGLCCVPVLARRGARLWVFGLLLFPMIATVALEIAVTFAFFQNQIQLGNFNSHPQFFWRLVFQEKVTAALFVWITLFPADYALNLFHRPPPINSAPDA